MGKIGMDYYSAGYGSTCDIQCMDSQKDALEQITNIQKLFQRCGNHRGMGGGTVCYIFLLLC